MKSLIVRRLRSTTDRLKRAESELAVVDEQLLFLRDTLDEARIRSLVSETPLAEADADDAQSDVDRLATYRQDLMRRSGELDRARDDLLDRLSLEVRD